MTDGERRAQRRGTRSNRVDEARGSSEEYRDGDSRVRI